MHAACFASVVRVLNVCQNIKSNDTLESKRLDRFPCLRWGITSGSWVILGPTQVASLPIEDMNRFQMVLSA